MRKQVWLHARSWFVNEHFRRAMTDGYLELGAQGLIVNRLTRVDDEIGNLLRVFGSNTPSRSERWRLGYGLLMSFMDENQLETLFTPEELEQASLPPLPNSLKTALRRNAKEVCSPVAEYSTDIHEHQREALL